jgi:hypothetical protein
VRNEKNAPPRDGAYRNNKRLSDSFSGVNFVQSQEESGKLVKVRNKLVPASELNSLNSYARNNGEVIDYFPEAPSDVVYWGLAGDIVRRIAPHTEADPVALLIQILAVFGNVIGRRAYTIADGALHALNIFAVACGGIE